MILKKRGAFTGASLSIHHIMLTIKCYVFLYYQNSFRVMVIKVSNVRCFYVVYCLLVVV